VICSRNSRFRQTIDAAPKIASWRDEQAGLSVFDDILNSRHACRHDGYARRHRLDQHEPETFGVGRRHQHGHRGQPFVRPRNGAVQCDLPA
jgi:hypothetical protein